MADVRSTEVFKAMTDAQQKLDYFLLGLASALFAYVGSQYQPMPLSFSQNTVELIAIIFLLASVLAGFKRVDFNISLMKLNFQELDMSEKKSVIQRALSTPGGVLDLNRGEQMDRDDARRALTLINETLPEVRQHMARYIAYSARSHDARNWLLILGFSALAVSKFVGVYFASQGV